MSSSKNGTSKYIKQNLLELKIKADISTITVGDFYTSFLIIDRRAKQTISKDMAYMFKLDIIKIKNYSSAKDLKRMKRESIA